MCFMVLVELNKSALTEDYIKYPSITARFSKHHLLDVLTTFKLIVCMNHIKKKAQTIYSTKILWTPLVGKFKKVSAALSKLWKT